MRDNIPAGPLDASRLEAIALRLEAIGISDSKEDCFLFLKFGDPRPVPMRRRCAWLYEAVLRLPVGAVSSG